MMDAFGEKMWAVPALSDFGEREESDWVLEMQYVVPNKDVAASF